jgi:hypothetical protein
MTQPPPGGYPPPDPGEQHPPPADPFYAPPSWEPPGSSGPPNQPTQPIPPGAFGSPTQPTQPIPPGGSYPPDFTQPIPPGGPYPPQPPQSGIPYSPAAPQSYPPLGPPPPPRRRRGPLIVAIVVAGALLLLGLGGVGAWLLTRDPDRNGPDSPTVAVQSFLQAIYHDQDASAAADLVCSEARDESALETKINEIRAYQQTQLNPTFSWTEPTVVEEQADSAVVAVTVTMVTGDEKVADQNLQLSVLDKDANGWWVCDVQTVEAATETQSTPTPSPTPSG